MGKAGVICEKGHKSVKTFEDHLSILLWITSLIFKQKQKFEVKWYFNSNTVVPECLFWQRYRARPFMQSDLSLQSLMFIH